MQNAQVSFQSGLQKLDKYGWNCVAKHISFGVITAILFFWAAGTLDWTWGWVMNILHTVCWIVLTLILIRENPELLNVRGNARKAMGSKGLDRLIVSLYGVLLIVVPVVTALDFRNGWVEPMPVIFRYLGVLMMIIGFAILTWSMVVNRHFEALLRIQDDRNHQVVSSGPYKYIRHPGYTAVILTVLPLAWIPGSWVATIPALIVVILFIFRTALEDRALQDGLEGYTAYTQQTPYRLIPLIW